MCEYCVGRNSLRLRLQILISLTEQFSLEMRRKFRYEPRNLHNGIINEFARKQNEWLQKFRNLIKMVQFLHNYAFISRITYSSLGLFCVMSQKISSRFLQFVSQMSTEWNQFETGQ